MVYFFPMQRFRFNWLVTVLVLTAARANALDDGLYAVLHTSMGSITAQLYYAEAPMTVANFIGLAEGTQAWMDDETGAVRTAPYYDGTHFHRVIEGFMIQGGSRTGPAGGPGYRFPDEIPNGLFHDQAGTLSMANSGLDSNGSQFFITVTNRPDLDGRYTVFGRVVSGQQVVSAINTVAVDESDRPVEDVVLESVDILRIGPEAEDFDGAHLLPIVSEGRIAEITQSAGSIDMNFEPDAFHVYHLRSSFDLISWTVTNLIAFADTFPATAPIFPGTNLANRTFYALTEMAYPGNAFPPASLFNQSVEFEFIAAVTLAGQRVRYDFSAPVGHSLVIDDEPVGSILNASFEYLLYPNRSKLLIIGTGIGRIDYRMDFETPTSGSFSAVKHGPPMRSQATGVFVIGD